MSLNPNTRLLQKQRDIDFNNPNTDFTKIDPNKLYEELSGVSEYSPTPTSAKFEDYSGNISGQIDPYQGDIDEQRAQNQGGLGLAGKFLGNMVTEASLGTLEGIGYAFDFEEWTNHDKQAQEGFDNWFSKGIREVKEGIQEDLFPVYQTREAQSGSFMDRMTDSTFWAAQGKTVGTTLSLMVPSLGVAGVVGKAGGALRATGLLGKTASALKIADTAIDIASSASAALFSRKAESAMEAYGVFDEQYNDLINQKDELGNNKYTDEQAKQIAGQAASTTFKANSAMLPIDMLQYATLLKPLQGFAKAGARFAESKIGGVAKVAFNAGSEGFEEGYQYIAGEEGKKQALGEIDAYGEGFGERFGEYIKDPEFQTSVALGAGMGLLFDFAGGPLANKVKDQYNKYSADKMRASLLGDVDSFNGIDDKISAQLIAKNLSTGRLDRLQGELDGFAKTISENEEYTQETKKEIQDKVNRIKDDATYVAAADLALQGTSKKFRKNNHLRNQYALTKLQYKRAEEGLADVNTKINKLNKSTDPKDIVLGLELDIAAHTKAKRRVALSKELNEDEKATEINRLDSIIKDVQQKRSEAINQIKSSLKEGETYDPKEYSHDKRNELLDLTIKKVQLISEKESILPKRMAEFEAMSDVNADKTEEEIQKDILARIAAYKQQNDDKVTSKAKSAEELANLKKNGVNTSPVVKGKAAAERESGTAGTSVVENKKISTPQKETKIEMLETPVRASHESVAKDDVIADADGNQFTVNKIDMMPNPSGKKQIFRLHVTDSNGKKSVKDLSANDKIIENYNIVGKSVTSTAKSTATPTSFASKYSNDGINLDDNKMHMFYEDVENLKNGLKTIFPNEPLIDQLDNVDFTNVVNTINQLQNHPDKSMATAMTNYINSYYANPELLKDIQTIENTNFSQNEAEEYIPTKEDYDALIMAEYWDFKFEGGKTVLDSEGNPVAGEKRINDKDFDPDLVRQPTIGNAGTVVTFDVDLKLKWNSDLVDKFNTGNATEEDLINRLNIYVVTEVDGKRVVLSILKGGMNSNIELRNAIFKQIAPKLKLKNKQLVQTTVTSKISNKTGGTILNTKNWGNPNTIAEELKKNGFAPDGLILAIVKTINGKNTIFVPNTNKHYAVTDNINLPEGSTVMLVKDASGKYTPIYVPTKKLSGLDTAIKDKKVAEARSLIEKALKSTDKKEVVDLVKQIQEIAYIPIQIKANGKNFSLVFTRTKGKKIRDAYIAMVAKGKKTKSAAIDELMNTPNLVDKLTRDQVAQVIERNADVHHVQFVVSNINDLNKPNEYGSPIFNNFFSDLRIQVDKTKLNLNKRFGKDLNKTDYNKSLADQGIITVNLNSKIPFHTPKFIIDPAFSVDGKVSEVKSEKKTTPKKKSEATVSETPREVIPSRNPEMSFRPSESAAELKAQREEAKKATPAEEVKAPAEQVKNEIKAKPRNPFLREVQSSDKSDFRPIDLEAELNWITENLPVGEGTDQVKLAVSKTLLRIGNKDAWGAFSEDLIEIYESALAGTGFHEAFHAVFEMALNPNEKLALLREASVRYNSKDVSYLKEKLAEQFAEDMLANRIEGKATTIIGRFFERLMFMIKNMIGINQTVNQLFHSINSGQYKNSRFYRSDATLLSEKPDSLITDTQREARVDNLTNFMTIALQDELNKSGNQNKNRAEIISALGSSEVSPIEQLIKNAILIAKGYQNYLNENDMLDEKSQFQFNYLVSQAFQLDNGEIPVGKLKLKYLGLQAIKNFAQIEGLTIRLDNGKTINGLDPETDSEVFERADDLDKVEHWQLESMQISRKDSAPADVRRELSYIRQYDHETKGDKFDDVGLPVYLSFSQAFATILREVADTTDRIEMLSEIKEFAKYKPEYKRLVEKLEADPDLMGKFWNGLQNTHANFMSIIGIENEDGDVSYIWSSDNRNKIESVIAQVWKSSLYDPYFANREIAEAFEEMQNSQNVVELRDKFAKSELSQAIKNAFDRVKKGISNASKKGEEADAYFTGVSGFLKEIGIDISPAEIGILYDNKMLSPFLTNISPVVNSIANGIDPYEANIQGLSKAIKNVKKIRDDLFESSFQSIARKTQYAHTLMGYLAKKMSQFKKNPDLVRQYMNDPLYKFLPWLNSLEEEMIEGRGDFIGNWNYAILSGIKDTDAGTGTPYNKMSAKELDIVRLNAFYNNGKEGWSYFMVPTMADSPTSMFIQAPATYTKEDAVGNVIDILRGEYARIKAFEEAKSSGSGEILDMAFYGNAPSASIKDNAGKFVLFPELAHLKPYLADIETNSESHDKVIEEVGKYLENEYNEEFNALIKSGIIEFDSSTKKYFSNKIHYNATRERGAKEQAVNNRYDDVESLVRNYVFNSIPATAQTILMFSGDVAMYKNPVDFFKRMKQLWTPVTRLDVHAEFILDEVQTIMNDGENVVKVRPEYNAVYIEDVELESKISQNILDIYLKKGYGNEAYSIAAKFGYANSYGVSYEVTDDGKKVNKIKLFSDKTEAELFATQNKTKYIAYSMNPITGFKVKSQLNTLTDGQSMIHPSRYREIQIGLKKWDAAKENDYIKVITGQQSDSNWGAFKPFVYGMKDYSGHMLPYQHKNSEYTLRPDVAYVTKEGKIEFPDNSIPVEERFNKYEAPELARMYAKMDGSLGIRADVVHFNTVVKVGDIYSTSIDNIENAVVQSFANEEYGLIQEVADHYTDDDGNFGVQLRKLAISDLDDSIEIKINGVAYNKAQIIQLWQDLISEDVAEDFAKLSKNFEYDRKAFAEGDFTSYNEALIKIQKLLLDDIVERNKGDQFEEALQLDTTGDKFRFVIPLFEPSQAKTTEVLLGAMFKNRVVKQKAPGGSLVQVSSVGFHEDLAIKFNEDGSLAYYEAAMPFWSKKYLKSLVDKNGNLDMSKVTDPKILELVGYRIPTEGKYSMIPIRIKKFLPRSAGGTLMLPLEITTITGSDFDIDKIFIMVSALRSAGKSIMRPKFNTAASRESYSEWVFEKSSKDTIDYIKLLSKDEKRNILRDAQSRFESFKNQLNFKGRLEEAKDTLKNGEIGDYIESLNNMRKNTLQELSDDLRSEFSDFKDELDYNNIRGVPRVQEYMQFTAGLISNDLSEEDKKLLSDLITIHSEELRMYGLKKEAIDKFVSEFNQFRKNGFESIENSRDQLIGTLNDDIADSLVEMNELQSYEQYSSGLKSDKSKYNTRAGRDNMKLDLLWGILTNETMNDQMLFPGENSRLDSYAEKIAQQRGLSTELSFLSPRTTTTMFERNMTGAGLIPVFANHNVNHAIAQHGDLSLQDAISYGGNNYSNLSGKYEYSKDGLSKTMISSNLAMFLRSILDNAKKPVSGFINLNNFTADIYALGLRLGMPIESVINIMNQPVITGLYEMYTNDGGNNKAYEDSLEKIREALVKKIGETKLEAKLNDETLSTYIGQNVGKSQDIQFVTDQLAVLDMFDEMYRRSKNLGSIVKLFRSDDSGRKITTASNEVFDMLYEKTVELDESTFNGIKDLLGKYSMMETFRYFAVDKTTEILNDHYMYNNQGFRDVKKVISDELKGFKELNDEQIEYINFKLLSYIASGYDFFNPNKERADGKSEKDYFINNFPSDFQKAISKYPALKNYAIIRHIEFTKKDKKNKLNRLIFRKTGGLSGQDLNRISKSWMDLLSDKRPEYRRFAESLIKYTYFSHGFVLDYGSFSPYIPTEWKANLQKDGQTYSDYLENMFDHTKRQGSLDGFIDQFYQHEYANRFFVEQLEDDDVRKKTKNNTMRISNDEPVLMTINSNEDKAFILKKSTINKFGKPSEPKFFKYLTVKVKGKLYLMKLASQPTPGSGTSFDAAYKPVPVKGIKGWAEEYDMKNVGITKSSIKENNLKNDPTKTVVTAKKSPVKQVIPINLSKPKEIANFAKSAESKKKLSPNDEKDAIDTKTDCKNFNI